MKKALKAIRLAKKSVIRAGQFGDWSDHFNNAREAGGSLEDEGGYPLCFRYYQ